MLVLSGSIRNIDRKYTFLDSLVNYKDFHFERMRISARHWSYGAVCHDNNIKFQDEIFTKTIEKSKKIDPAGYKYASMVSFLKEQSGLKEIYI